MRSFIRSYRRATEWNTSATLSAFLSAGTDPNPKCVDSGAAPSAVSSIPTGPPKGSGRMWLVYAGGPLATVSATLAIAGVLLATGRRPPTKA